MLTALAKMRFLTTTQLRELGFPSRAATNKRMRDLQNAGYVRVWCPGLAQDNVYSLTPKGGGLLVERGELDDRPAIPQGLDGLLSHTREINGVRITFIKSGALTWWWSDWELRGLNRQTLVPDAVFGVRWEDETEDTFALELDNRSRSPQGFLRKILRYAGLRQHGRTLCGVSEFTTLVVVRDPWWSERYRTMLTGLAVRGTWFTTLAALKERGPLEGIWNSPECAVQRSLREAVSFLTVGNAAVPQVHQP